MTDPQILQARAAFVAMVKKDDEFRDAWFKTSLRASYKGALHGFYSDGTQRRWQDFLAGWKASAAVEREACMKLCEDMGDNWDCHQAIVARGRPKTDLKAV